MNRVNSDGVDSIYMWRDKVYNNRLEEKRIYENKKRKNKHNK